MNKSDKKPKYIIVAVSSDEELQALTSFPYCRYRFEKEEQRTEWFPAKMDEEKNVIYMVDRDFIQCTEYLDGGHILLQ